MLRDFWEKKKHIIQLGGIIIAVGALFLSIPPPDNEVAKIALSNIQFAWLIIITVILVSLFLNFVILGDIFEKELKDKKKIDFDTSLVLLIVFIGGWILYYLWVYILNLYKASFTSFFSVSSGIIAMIFSTTSLFLSKKIPLPQKLIKFTWEIHIFIGIFVFALSYGFLSELTKPEFLWTSWFKNVGLLSSVFLIVFAVVLIYKRIKSKSLINKK